MSRNVPTALMIILA